MYRHILIFMLFSMISVHAFCQEITGTVTDANGDPTIGVSIIVKGTQRGTTTDLNGKFSLMADPTETLVISYIGFHTQEVSGRNNYTITLQEDNQNLNEIVVIGYGFTTKKEVTGSVASLKAKSLNKGIFTNAMGLLQGKVAGLSVVNANGGDPNAKYEILLRGTNTLSAGQGPLVIIDGVAGADIRNINYEEVESIDILKDGSAAAIYGTRGTNGVIIVTTKRAHAGTTQVNYEAQFSLGVVNRRAKPLSATDYREVIKNYRPELTEYIGKDNTDWFKEITRTPIGHSHSVALSGGTEKFSHHTNINYQYQQGLQRKNYNEKMIISSNIRQSLLDSWLDMDYNIRIAHRRYYPSSTSAFQQAFTHNPTTPVYDASNTEAGGYSRTVAMQYYNPVAMINECSMENEDDNYGGNLRASLNIKCVPGLKWDNFLSYDREKSTENTYYSHYYPSYIGTNGLAKISNVQYDDTQFQSTLNYFQEFGKHTVQALLGYEYQYQKNSTSGMENSYFDVDDYLWNNIGAGAYLSQGKASMNSYKEDNTYIAYFGRIMYNYDDRYLLSFSMRRDGSSRFGNNNKWGWFPAVSAGWRINKESFMKDAKWMDDLKLRIGYGVTGNQDFSNYKSLMLMSVAGYCYYNGRWIHTYQPASNANPDLQWERKNEFNVGLDFGFFDGRISGTIDFYHRLTTNLLYSYTVPTPPYVYDTIFTNVGEISNNGIEITLSVIPVRVKDFEWNMTYTLSHNSNKLKKFTNKEFENGTYKVGWSTSGACYTQRLIERESLGTFYGPVWTGIDANGNDILKGQGSDGSVPEEQWEKIGNAYPDFQMGWSNNFRYKKFDLGFSLRASIGGDILNNYAMEYANLSSLGLRNISEKWLDCKEFTSTTYKYSSKYIESASFLKLDYVSLGYNLDFKSKFIHSLRLALTAQNVFCITKYKGVDPEVALSGLEPGIEYLNYYPRTTQFTFGVKVEF